MIVLCIPVQESAGDQTSERFRGFNGKGKGKGKVGLPFRTLPSHRQQIQIQQGHQTSNGFQGMGKQTAIHASRAGLPESSPKVLGGDSDLFLTKLYGVNCNPTKFLYVQYPRTMHCSLLFSLHGILQTKAITLQCICAQFIFCELLFWLAQANGFDLLQLKFITSLSSNSRYCDMMEPDLYINNASTSFRFPSPEARSLEPKGRRIPQDSSAFSHAHSKLSPGRERGQAKRTSNKDAADKLREQLQGGT